MKKRQFLIDAMSKTKISTSELAEKTNLTQQFINYVINGKRTPKHENIKKICAELGYTYTWFYELDIITQK